MKRQEEAFNTVKHKKNGNCDKYKNKRKIRWKNIKEQERWKQSEQIKPYRQKKDKDGSNNEKETNTN